MMNEKYLLESVEFFKNVEPTMQRLHDEGHWKWITRQMSPDFCQGPTGKPENGILYVFEVL